MKRFIIGIMALAFITTGILFGVSDPGHGETKMSTDFANCWFADYGDVYVVCDYTW